MELECPGSGELPEEMIPRWDFQDKGICPVCKQRCGLMLNVDIGKEVIKPHGSEPCPECGCPGEKYDGHVCTDYLRSALRDVRAWIETDLPAALNDDPSGFIAGVQSASVLERIDQALGDN